MMMLSIFLIGRTRSYFLSMETPEKDFLDVYIKMDDNSIYDLVLSNCDKSGLAYQIINDLKNRKLFKRAYDTPFSNINSISRMNIRKMDLKVLEQKLSDKSGIPIDLIIVHSESDEGGKKGYRTLGRITDSGEIP